MTCTCRKNATCPRCLGVLVERDERESEDTATRSTNTHKVLRLVDGFGNARWDERPVHQPAAPDAPIPGNWHYSACDPDQPRVNPNGICEGCGEHACPDCGLENCAGCEVA